jgi:membrane protein YqaA with SNARE-associated domain
MRFGHFLLAIFSGRCVRFLILAILTLRFGPGFVHVAAWFFRKHSYWILVAVAVGLAAWLVTWQMGKKARR